MISRPIYAWAKNKPTANFTLRSFSEYGDSAGLPSPEGHNVNGMPYQSYDEAGRVQSSAYDFKGNVLNKSRQVISTTELKTQVSAYKTYIVDWTGLPNILDIRAFGSDMEYGALNRMTRLNLPADVAGNRKDIIPAYNKAGGLQQVTYDGTVYVENIVYDAKGMSRK